MERDGAMEREDSKDCNVSNVCNVSIVSDSLVLRKGLATLLKAHSGLRVVGSHSGLRLDALNKPDASNGLGTISISTAPSLPGVPGVPNPPGHVVLLDAGLGREVVVALIQYWRNQEPPALVVIIEAPNDLDLILACIIGGAVGCLPRGASPAEVIEAIGQVRQGDVHCSPEVAAGLFAWIAAQTRSDSSTSVPKVPTIPVGRVIAVGPDGPARPDGAAVPRTGYMDQDRPEDGLRLTHREMEIMRLLAEGRTNKEIAEKLVIATNTVKNHVHHILGKLELESRLQVTPLAVEIGRDSDKDGHGPSADWN